MTPEEKQRLIELAGQIAAATDLDKVAPLLEELKELLEQDHRRKPDNPEQTR